MKRSVLGVAIAAAGVCSQWAHSQAEPLSPVMQRAQELYVVCGSCHGAHAQGERSLETPALAGQLPSYLMRQLKLFASGGRGGANDSQGQQMQQILQTISAEQDWKELIDYIGTLPVKAATPAESGRGRELYQACSGCHGAAGEGTEALSAPRLSALPDWYIASQLRKFKAGVRGAGGKDIPGMQMRAASTMLKTDADIAVVSAYIGTRSAQ